MTPLDGAPGDVFGVSVALDGTTLLVGAFGDEDDGYFSGSAYLFDLATGQELAKLVPADGAVDDRFGTWVDLDGGVAVVAAPGDGGTTLSGSVYSYAVPSGQLITKIEPYVWGEFGFGETLALSGNKVLIGGGLTPAGEGALATAFDALTGLELSQLVPLDPAFEAGQSGAVALLGDTAIVGLPRSDAAAPDAGAAYVFDLGLAGATPFCFGDGSGAPCANPGYPGNGCRHGDSPYGAHLYPEGSPCLTGGAFKLRVGTSSKSQPGVLFQGDNAIQGGAGIGFGDGLRCAGGNVLRLELLTTNAAGFAESSIDIAAAAGLSAGDVKRYQWWYRDPGNSPCGSGFNLPNGLEVTWGSERRSAVVTARIPGNPVEAEGPLATWVMEATPPHRAAPGRRADQEPDASEGPDDEPARSDRREPSPRQPHAAVHRARDRRALLRRHGARAVARRGLRELRVP